MEDIAMFILLALVGIALTGAAILTALAVVAVSLKLVLRLLFWPLALVAVFFKLIVLLVCGAVLMALALPVLIVGGLFVLPLVLFLAVALSPRRVAI